MSLKHRVDKEAFAIVKARSNRVMYGGEREEKGVLGETLIREDWPGLALE